MFDKSAIVPAQHSNFNYSEVSAFIHLFKMAPANVEKLSEQREASSLLFEGLVFINEKNEVLESIPSVIHDAAVARYGSKHTHANMTFYKSFNTVASLSDSELVLDQIRHYFTTYGAESLGLTVPTYVPVAELEVPEYLYNKNSKFVVIRIVDRITVIQRLNEYLQRLAAPSAMVVPSIHALLPYTTLGVDAIKSFEVQIMKHKLDGTVPEHPVSALRYIVYEITHQTLLIKNRTLCDSIKNSYSKFDSTAADLFSKCNPYDLSSIFLRYKPIFLAFKSHKGCAPMINRLRRLAVMWHKPLTCDVLQNVLNIEDPDIYKRILRNASNRELVKVINAILVKSTGAPRAFAIRNGRTFVTTEPAKASAAENDKLDYAQTLLVERLGHVLRGKKFYIPKHIDYAVPTTEKQFIGNIPFGTHIIAANPDNGFTAGVHWVNREGRVDIDLHMNSKNRHFGWNGDYRDANAGIYYTGDQTDAPAPNGAAEAYYVQPGSSNESLIVSVNLYSGPRDMEFEFFMSETAPPSKLHNKKYTFDPNEAMFPAIPLKFNGADLSQTIGLFTEGDFYFYGGGLSNNVVPSGDYPTLIDALTVQMRRKLRIWHILFWCGATVLSDNDMNNIRSIEDPTERAEALNDVISLAAEDLTATSLTDIIDGTI